MTREQEMARRQASEDMVDIAALKKNTEFNRYWMRQLRVRRDAVRKAFESDPPEKCPHEEREILRRLLKAYNELERMPDEHAASAEALLRQPV